MEIVNKIKNLSLEQVNKNLIFIAILSLLFRTGSFFTNHIPQPFELIAVLIVVLTVIDAIKNNKIKEFFFSVPKNIRIALFCLVSSILLGWTVSILRGIPTTFNMILEFGSFVFSLSIFLLILFYTRNDKTYIKKYFYALLIGTIYVIFALFPKLAIYFHLVSGDNFIGLTTNRSIIYKILLIPTIFFTTYSLFESKNKWLKIGYIFISSALVALLFWTGERGALLCLVIGIFLVGLVFLFNSFNWKKVFSSVIIILIILLIGFNLAPQAGKLAVLNRSFSNDSYSDYSYLKDKLTISKLIINVPNIDQIKGSRIQIWLIYLKEVLIKNPFGVGPNTHMNVVYLPGDYWDIGPHNSYLQIWLWSGLFGLSSFLYLLWSVFKNLKIRLKSNFGPTTVALLCIFLTLSIAIIFNDSISFYPFWVILALSLVKYEKSFN